MNNHKLVGLSEPTEDAMMLLLNDMLTLENH